MTNSSSKAGQDKTPGAWSENQRPTRGIQFMYTTPSGSSQIIESTAHGISRARLQGYLSKTDDDLQRAIALYTWNSRMSAECFIAIGHLEVLLRNTIDTAFQDYCADSLRGIPWFLQLHSGLHKTEQENIATAREHLAREGKPDSRDRVIAQLTFGFWTRLFGKTYDELWKRCLHKVFANGMNPSITRREVVALLEHVRLIRNHAAHQNFMKREDVANAANDILHLADLISPSYATWMRNDACRLHEVYDQCPEKDVR